MKITRRNLKRMIEEALELSTENRRGTLAAMQQIIDQEGGAMGFDALRDVAQDESGVTMSREDFEELAGSIDFQEHDKGDIVDMKGLDEGNAVKITRRQLKHMIREVITSGIY